ncbi:MAG: nicotinamide mononucleotide transporter [Saprospiraceae bacterium]|nr:nicotinamide mononucleotide transporter [Saprospiraceae bacterium]
MMEIVAAAVSLGWLQWLAVLFNVLYVIFAAREQIICWVFGLVGVTLLFFIYLEARLYSDTVLQVFYMVMSVYGWISWSKSKNDPVKIHVLRLKSHLGLIVLGIAGTLVLGFVFGAMGAVVPYIDAFTSSFAVVATYLVAKKVLENWIYWIVIDSVCVVVYYTRDLPLISLLFALYTILAVFGLRSWQIRYKLQTTAK